MSRALAYRARFRRVLEHIDDHLEEELSVDRLSAVAAFSKYHFHRQFSALYGVGVHAYVRMVRLRRAAFRLAFRPDLRVIDIALTSGYESHEAFCRAFKKAAGQPPSEFRAQPRWLAWHDVDQHLSELRSQHMKPTHAPRDVSIVDFPATRIAVMEHRGDPRTIGGTIQRFIAWRRRVGLTPRTPATFNLLYGEPEQVPAPEGFRLDLCTTTDRPVADPAEGISEREIPAGRCARLRHLGSDDTLEQSVLYLYATWLPGSGEEPRDFPVFLQRVHFFPDVPEHEAITDVFLPLR